jgi:hypothetical protein
MMPAVSKPVYPLPTGDSVWSACVMLDAASRRLTLTPPAAQMSGINLLQYKSGRGVIGQTCYGRYLREAFELISHYGGGLYYFGEVRCCVSPADDDV